MAKRKPKADENEGGVAVAEVQHTREQLEAAAKDIVDTILLSGTALNEDLNDMSDSQLIDAIKEASEELVGTTNLKERRKADKSIEGPDSLNEATKQLLQDLECDPGVLVRMPEPKKEEKAAAKKDDKKPETKKEEPAARTPKDIFANPGATTLVAMAVCENPTISVPELAKMLKDKGKSCNDGTIGMQKSDTLRTIHILEKMGKLKG